MVERTSSFDETAILNRDEQIQSVINSVRSRKMLQSRKYSDLPWQTQRAMSEEEYNTTQENNIKTATEFIESSLTNLGISREELESRAKAAVESEGLQKLDELLKYEKDSHFGDPRKVDASRALRETRETLGYTQKELEAWGMSWHTIKALKLLETDPRIEVDPDKLTRDYLDTLIEADKETFFLSYAGGTPPHEEEEMQDRWYDHKYKQTLPKRDSLLTLAEVYNRQFKHGGISATKMNELVVPIALKEIQKGLGREILSGHGINRPGARRLRVCLKLVNEEEKMTFIDKLSDGVRSGDVIKGDWRHVTMEGHEMVNPDIKVKERYGYSYKERDSYGIEDIRD